MRTMNFKLLLIVFVMISFNGMSQGWEESDMLNTDVYLVNNLKPKKKIRIMWDSGMDISLDCELADTVAEQSMNVTGSLVRYEDSTIVLQNWGEKTTTWNNDGSFNEQETHYWASSTESYTEVNVGNIDYITHNKPAGRFIRSTGTILTGVGAAVVLIGAPLLSIQYSSLTMDGDKYMRFAAVGGSMAAVGLPMMLLTKPKKYTISDRKEKKHWSFQGAPEE